MRITPREPDIPKVGGFTNENDIFGYRDFAHRLANLVRNVDEPLVVTLDGEWGSGKSVFVRQWAGLLRERGAYLIEFDAFPSDYYEDAFIALSAEIYAAAKETLGGSERAARPYLNGAKKAGAVLAPIALRVAARAGTAGLLSLDDIEASSEAIKAAVEAAGNESTKAVERAISERLRKASEDRAELAAFREALSEVAAALTKREAGEDTPFPLVFIVDELDRCRPPFALSVIERIKHLFSVDGVCFVLVTHLPQLEAAIQGAYGPSLDAHEYLEKFYQLRVTLPRWRDRPAEHHALYVDYLWRALEITFGEARYNQSIKEQIQALAKAHDLPLRRLERVLTNVALVNAAVGPGYLIISPIVAGLCVMRQVDPKLYNKARRGVLNWEEVGDFLQLNENDENHRWSVDWWKYATGGELSGAKIGELQRGLFDYNVGSRENLIPYMAEYIDNLAQLEPHENQ